MLISVCLFVPRENFKIMWNVYFWLKTVITHFCVVKFVPHQASVPVSGDGNGGWRGQVTLEGLLPGTQYWVR